MPPVYTIMEAAFQAGGVPFKVQLVPRATGSQLVLPDALPLDTVLNVNKIFDINQFKVDESEKIILGGQERIWTIVP